MFYSLLFMVVLMATTIQSSFASPFYEWLEQGVKDYAKSLMAGAEKTKKGQRKDESLARIKEAKAQKKWPVAVAELETLVGQNTQDLNLWLDLALTAYHAMTEAQQRSYELMDKAEKAAAYVYFNSSDKTQRALALLISAAVTTNADTQEKCLTELSTLVDIKKLRQDYPAYADLMPFAYKEYNVDRDSNTPQVCFNFSHPLQADFKPADYFEISPKIDGAFHIRNTKICLTGIRFGENYNVLIKEGLPSIFGEKTTQSSKFNFLVDDKTPRLSFPTKTYILQKNDDLLIPLTAVNVKKIDIKVVRVNDRAFIEGFGRPYRSLDEEVSAYQWKDIANRYGEPVYSGTMEIGGETNKNITKQISLNDMVKNLQPGAYGILVRDSSTKEDYSSLSASQWVLVTDIGMTVFKGTSGLDVNVRSLSSAQPLNQIGLKLMSYNNQVLAIQNTNSEGFVHFDEALLQGKGGNRPAFIFAYGGEGNFAALKLSEPAFDLSDRGVEGRKVSGPLDAFLYMERGVYRPGEQIRVMTLLRNMNAKEVGGFPLTFHLIRPDGVVVQTETLAGNAHGYYELNTPLSPSSRTGQWTVQVFADPKADPIGQTQFSVEDFVPTRLLVTLKSPETLFILGKPLPIDVIGRYLFGSPARGLGGDGSCVIRKHPNPFPKYKDYQFGLVDDGFVSTRFELELPMLNEEGKAKLDVTTDTKIDATVPLQAVIQAAIRDEGGRPQLGTLRLDVQTYPHMIGIKGKFKNGAIDFRDKNADLEIITINSKGEHVPVKNLHYTLYQEDLFYNWSQSDRGGSWEYKPVREDKQLKEGQISSASDGPTILSLPIEGWGYYRVEIKDPDTGALSSYRFTKGYLSADSKTQSPDKLTVVQDKPAYNVGETVRLHIDSPFDGEALFVIADQEVLESRNIKVSKAGTDVSFKVPASWGAGAYVLISAFRPLNRKEKDPLQNALMPKRAVGLCWIAVSTEPRTLKISMTPPKEIAPRQKLNLPIHVDGNVKADTFVTVAAVDEGILMLTDFKSPKPQDYYFGKRMLGVEMRDLYGKILDAIPGEMGSLKAGGDEGVLARNLAALSKRSFRIVSLFQGPVTLDSKGNATVSLDIPDFNGTLRLMAVAFNQNDLGSTDAQLLVRDPIVSEPVLPRFLSVGDTSQMSLSLFNPVGDKKEVKLVIKGTGAVESSEQTRSVLLEKDGAWHTHVPLKGKSIGDGAITFTISGEGFTPITRTFEMSVRPSTSPTSTKSTYLLQPGETKKLDFKNVNALLPTTASLTISASDRIPWDLTSIIKSLIGYPYGCVEQTVSKGFAILYKKSMGIFEKDKNQKDLDKLLFKISSILAERQDNEGGFALWGIYEQNADAWLTAYAFDFMQQAKQQGWAIPETTFEKTSVFLRNFVKSQSSNSTPEKLAIAAYAISLIAGQDVIEDGAVRYFFDTHFEKLVHPLSRAQVGLALAKIGDLPRAKRAFEDFTITDDTDPTLLPYGSLIRNRAALIKVLIDIVKIAPSVMTLADVAESQIKLLGQQITPSNPLSTQEQACLLQAAQTLATNMNKGEKNAEGTSQLSINDKVTTVNKMFSQIMNEDEISEGVSLTNKGKNPLWVNAVLYGFPKEAPKAIEKGIKITKKYYTLAGQEFSMDNKTPIKQGEQFIVLVKGDMKQKSSPEVVHYMLIVDWLPAGFEIESGRLGALLPQKDSLAIDNKASTSDANANKPERRFSFNFGTTKEHKPAQDNQNNAQLYPWDNLTKTLTTEARDDRFVASVKLTGTDQSFTLAYRVRAVTPGVYGYSGLHVEDMFIPTIYANTGGGTVEIQGKE